MIESMGTESGKPKAKVMYKHKLKSIITAPRLLVDL